MKKATYVAELTILIIALIISVVADILPVVGRIAGRIAGRLYRNRHKPVAWLKLVYSWIRYGSYGLTYSRHHLSDASADFIGSYSVDNHLRFTRIYGRDRYRNARAILIRCNRRLTALYRASYGMIAQWLIAQSGVPVEVPDPRLITAERNRRIRAIMANY